MGHALYRVARKALDPMSFPDAQILKHQVRREDARE
jgi:hypothetical protein